MLSVSGVVCEAPDADLDKEKGESKDDVDEVTASTAAQTDGRGIPWLGVSIHS